MLKTPRLREWRERATLSQGELKERSGVSRATIADLEAGNRGAQPRTIRRLAEALNVEPDDLYAEPLYPKAEARLSQLQESRLREVRERFAPMADLLNHYSRTFEEQVEEGSLTQADVEQYVFHATLAGEPMGKAYTDELQAIADALDLEKRTGERVVLDGISRAQANAELREAMHQHSLMYAALRRYYAVGEALAESVGDAETAERMQDKTRALEVEAA